MTCIHLNPHHHRRLHPPPTFIFTDSHHLEGQKVPGPWSRRLSVCFQFGVHFTVFRLETCWFSDKTPIWGWNLRPNSCWLVWTPPSSCISCESVAVFVPMKADGRTSVCLKSPEVGGFLPSGSDLKISPAEVWMDTKVSACCKRSSSVLTFMVWGCLFQSTVTVPQKPSN